MTRRVLTPVTITEQYPDRRTGLTETWTAVTLDRQWEIAREDAKGTSWATYSVPSVADGSCPVPVMYSATLEDAQESIASGYAETALKAAKAALAGAR